ncbi:MAG: chemotaxis protein CheD [Candidatus Omnitrophica bacterium]|nr:chemotaxis protein CheD [Candidatus Omnitrophota bacterium]MCB9748128.1 chemotaxis protein CheD [Candidatus Omnitrophota bacterium]
MTDNVLIVGIADIKTGKAPFLIKTTLGSCIGVCLYHQEKKVGGMLHLMLASSEGIVRTGELKRAKFADTGIPDLIHELKVKHDADISGLSAKIFGGAKVLQGVTSDIGKNNEEAVRTILKQFGVKIIASKTGGEKGYQIEFDLDTGKVLCKIFGQEPVEL